MARAKWFDGASNELLFSKYVDQMSSWQEAIADGVIDPEEIDAQVERVGALLQEVEPLLTDALHDKLTNIFYEMAVLYGMVQMSEAALLDKGGK